MKFIQTFWTRPANQHSSLDIKGGWLFSESHWMSWALSCLQVKKYYGKIELITDNRGKEILIDRLGLPYSHVSTSLEGRLDKYPAELWSLAKIYSYSIQNEPFIHLDGDVFIWDKFEERIIAAGVAAQNLEFNLAYYRNILESIDNHFPYMPQVLKKAVDQKKEINASNTGIFGGHNLPFIKNYCNSAFSFVDKNLDLIATLKNAAINFIFEQCLLYYEASASNQTITYLIDQPVTDPSYSGYARFLDIPTVKMLHTLGGYKILPSTSTHLGKRLRKEYPAYYYKILDVYQKQNITMRNKVYYLPPFNSPGFMESLVHSSDAVLSINNAIHANLEADDSKTVSPTNYETEFKRTIAAIQYINPGAFGNRESGRTKNNSFTTEHLDYEISCMNHELKERVEEIFRLESKKITLTESFHDRVSMLKNHSEEILNYKQSEELFEKEEQQILNTGIGLDDKVCIFDLSCNWNMFDLADTLEVFIKKRLNAGNSLEQVALVPDFAELAIEEIYLSNLEMIIVAICADDMSIETAISEIKQYLEPEELDKGYESYRALIFMSVRRLLYSGILRII
jgi:hypothetical protein